MLSDVRLHPLSFVFELGAHAKRLLVPGIVALFAARTGGWGWEVWAMLLIVPYAVAAIGRALSFRYRFDPGELVIRTGFIFRRERHIPYDRIQNIDSIQNVVHRICDVVAVRIETGGGTEAEAELNVLSVAAFRDMRDRIFAGRARPEAAGGELTREPHTTPTALLRLPAREIALWGLIRGQGFVVVGALFGVLWELGLLDRIAAVLFGEDSAGGGVLRKLALALFRQGVVPTRELLVTLAAFALLMVVMRVFSVGLALARFHGFTLVLAGDDLRSEFGLLTRVAASVPAHRIQTLTVHEGPLHRLFRRASISVETAGGEAEEAMREQRQWLVPVLRPAVVQPLLRTVLPVVNLGEATWRSVHPRAFRRALLGSLIVAIAISAGLAALLQWWTLAVFAGLLGWALVDARLYVSRLRWSLTDDAVVFRSGWLWQRLTVAPLAKVQAVSLHESPFDRRSGMASVSVDTAGAGDAVHRIAIPYLPREVANDLRQRLATAAAQTPFRW